MNMSKSYRALGLLTLGAMTAAMVGPGRPAEAGAEPPRRESSKSESARSAPVRRPVAVGGDPACVDHDGDGYGDPGDASCDNGAARDCDDTDALVHPGATERCNGVDDNCVDGADEPDAAGCVTYYRDGDNDTYGVDADTQCLCASASPYTATRGGDCDDTDSLVNSGATEICNGKDDDCDGQVDEGFLYHGRILNPVAVCRGGDHDGLFCQLCAGGAQTGELCDDDADCPGGNCQVGCPDGVCEVTVIASCVDGERDGASCRPQRCDGGDRDRLECGADSNGCPDGICRTEAQCECGDRAGELCVDDLDCPRGTCITTKQCDGGDRDGLECGVGSTGCPGGTCIIDCPGGTCTPIVEDDLSVGATCVSGWGPCTRVGRVVCSQDGSAAVCDAVPDSSKSTPESLNCKDRIDNDCDSLFDFQDIDCQREDEVCDGFDNNNDGRFDEGFALGGCCAVGMGACENFGVYVCAADGTGVVCNARPGLPDVEGPPASRACTDGIDNDCDGFVDLQDPSCQERERCDGIDNNGDGLADETFPELRRECSVGVGACRASGIFICSGDQTGTICAAVPRIPSPETPLARTCDDGVDNDCDGVTDGDDSSCMEGDLTVRCALPYLHGQTGNDCTGWHTIEFAHNGGENAVVTAEFLAFDTTGALMQTLPVGNGDEVHLASRVDEEDFKMWSKVQGPHGMRHQVFAPIPILRVTVRNDTAEARAYCSNIPYLEVVQPNNSVLNGENDALPVEVMIPRVDPHSLLVWLDGVDIVAGLGLDPILDFPGGPYSGVVDVNGSSVTIEDFVVDVGAIGELSSNTLRMTVVRGLGCGGHVFLVDGAWARGSFPWRPGKPTSSCHADEVRDTGTAMLFQIEVTHPSDGEVTDGGPTRVTGSVCHGKEIVEVGVNGFDVDVGSQLVTKGNGETSADSYTLDFDVSIPMTNLRAGIAAGDTTGSFDHGSNLLVARAMDGDFNTTFDTLTFAVGPIVPASSLGGGFATAAGVDDAELSCDGGENDGSPCMDDGECPHGICTSPDFVKRAFVFGINTSGLEKTFSARKDRSAGCIRKSILERVKEHVPKGRDVEVPDGCTITTEHQTLVAGEPVFRANGDGPPLNFDLSLTPRDGSFDVKFELPDMESSLSVSGECYKGCLFGENWSCAVCAFMNVTANIKIEGMFLRWQFTEDYIVNHERRQQRRRVCDESVDWCQNGVCAPDSLKPGSPCGTHKQCETILEFDKGTSGFEATGSLELGCAFGWVVKALDAIAEFFGGDLISFELDKDRIKDKLKAKFENLFPSRCRDPMNTRFVNLTNRDLDRFDSRQVRHKITDVRIRGPRCAGGDDDGQNCTDDNQCSGDARCLGGLALSVGSAFQPRRDRIDSGADADRGTPQTEAPLPLPPIKDWMGEPADDVTIAISDDVFNQLFSNMTRTGKLRRLDASVGPLADFMPADCDSIFDGRCEGGTNDGAECEDNTGCPDGSCIQDCDDTCMGRRARCFGWRNAGVDGFCESSYPRRVCSAGPNVGGMCALGDGDSATRDCHVCRDGTPHAGATCTIDAGCGRVCVGGDNDGDECASRLACGGGGDCNAISGACDTSGSCGFNPLRRHCRIGQFFGERFNVGFDKQVWFKPDITLGPKLLIDDDPATQDAVEVKLLLTALQAYLIVNRDGNVDEHGDPVFDHGWDNLDTLERCCLSHTFDEVNEAVSNTCDPPETQSECYLWKHSLSVVANLSPSIEKSERGRPRLRIGFLEIDRQATGGFSVAGVTGILDLGSFNRRADRDRSLNLLESTIRDNTPELAPEGLDLDDTVEFQGTCVGGDQEGADCVDDTTCTGGGTCVDVVRVIAIRTRPEPTCAGGTCDSGPSVDAACVTAADCPDDGYQDYIGITGPLTKTPRPPAEAICADYVCAGGTKAGDACADNQDCRGGTCADWTCAGGDNADASCSADGDCPGGHCVTKRCDSGYYQGEACTEEAFCRRCPGEDD